MALLAGLLGLFLLAGFISAIGSALGGDTDTQATSVETVWGEGDAGTTIRSIPVTGPILTDSASGGSEGLFGMATYGYDVAEQLDELGKSEADAVVLEMDTPGGTITGSRAIADAVTRYQERTGRPVVAFVRGMSASGGMYAMAGTDEVIADHGTLVGSIGVIMGPLQRYKDVRALDGGLFSGGVTAEGGITQEYFTKGKGKDFGNPFRDITPQERRVMEQGLGEEYTAFVQRVADGRGISPATIRNELGAYVFSPRQAVSNGLVDRVLGADEAYRRIAKLAEGDPDDARVVRESGTSLWDALASAESGAEQPSADELERAEQLVRGSEVCTGVGQVLVVHQQASFCH